MPYKIQEQEFTWVSMVGTWNCKAKKKYICICSVSLWKEHISSHSPQDNICLFSSSISCVKDVYPQTPQVTSCAGYLLAVLQCQAHPLSLLCDTGAGACYSHQTHLLVALGFGLESGGGAKGRQLAKGFFIAISCHFHFDNRR